MDYERLDVRDGYDRWASIYDDEDNPLIKLEQRYWDDLVGEVAGRHVLDVGCGTGRQSLRLADRGAIVTAVDLSEGMLARAQAKPGADRVAWLRHDSDAPLPFDNGTFDLVISCLVLEHVPDLKRFFVELKRVCRPGGAIAVSTMHPAMNLKGISARFTDPTTGRETRPTSHPHTISDYVMAALHAGLSIKHLSEHRVDEALAELSPRAAKYLDWPMLFLMRLNTP